MPTGFIYVVPTVTRGYVQRSRSCVPTDWTSPLYFGPCKRSMRPKMQRGDYVFGVSPSPTRPRRIVFVAKIEKRMTFAEAYRRFPKLHGPGGPIHVRPVKRSGSFPRSDYEHIPGSMHKKDWYRDLASRGPDTRELDAFFVCSPADGCVGRWLGERGPEVDDEILEFLKTCSVHGVSSCLAEENTHASRNYPIVHRGPRGLLYKGLHLETDAPEVLLALCDARTQLDGHPLDTVPRLLPPKERTSKCGTRRKASVCRSTDRASDVVGAKRILLLRVGMDLGFGGLGPLFADGRFEYVPIPEDPKKTCSRSLYFSQLPARFGGTLERFVPPRYRTGPAHYDPEFDTFTYGDPTRNKRRQLLRLASNDMLVFYAGLRPPDERRGSRLYVIGYFTVQSVHDVTTLKPWPPPALKHLWANAHFRRKKPDVGLVVVEGSHQNSRLLQSALALSDDRQLVLPEMERRVGLTGSVMRAGAGRWVPATHVAGVERWLRSLEVSAGAAASR